MICPNCKKENMNEYATVCAYCNQPLYSSDVAEAKAVELSAKQKKDKNDFFSSSKPQKKDSKKDKKGKKKDDEMGFFAKKAKKLAEKEANRAKSQKK